LAADGEKDGAEPVRKRKTGKRQAGDEYLFFESRGTGGGKPMKRLAALDGPDERGGGGKQTI